MLKNIENKSNRSCGSGSAILTKVLDEYFKIFNCGQALIYGVNDKAIPFYTKLGAKEDKNSNIHRINNTINMLIEKEHFYNSEKVKAIIDSKQHQ